MPKCFAANAEDTLDVVLEVAKELSCAPAQVATRWILEQPGITSAIIGARHCEQLKDNIGSANIRFTVDQLVGLNTVSHLPVRYPLTMEANMHERRDDAVKMPRLND